MKILQNNIFYTKAAAARISNTSSRLIITFEIWADVCFVRVKGQKPTFISKKAFQSDFVEFRIKQSEKLVATKIDEQNYLVSNPDKSTSYTVFFDNNELSCNCFDYQNQSMIIGREKAACKHIYRINQSESGWTSNNSTKNSKITLKNTLSPVPTLIVRDIYEAI